MNTVKNKKAVNQIIDKALSLHRDDFTIFIDFSGHVDSISVSWNNGGWTSGSSADGSVGFSTDQPISQGRVQEILDVMDEASDNNEKLKAKAILRRENEEIETLKRLKEKYGD